MITVWVEVDNAPLAEATSFREKRQVKTWIAEQLDMYLSIGEKITFEIQQVDEDKGGIIQEPFGQRFVGLLETNELDRRILEQADRGLTIEQHRSSILIQMDSPFGTILKSTSLPVECVYVLYYKLKEMLFGTPEQDITPKFKQE